MQSRLDADIYLCDAQICSTVRRLSAATLQ